MTRAHETKNQKANSTSHVPAPDGAGAGHVQLRDRNYEEGVAELAPGNQPSYDKQAARLQPVGESRVGACDPGDGVVLDSKTIMAALKHPVIVPMKGNLKMPLGAAGHAAVAANGTVQILPELDPKGSFVFEVASSPDEVFKVDCNFDEGIFKSDLGIKGVHFGLDQSGKGTTARTRIDILKLMTADAGKHIANKITAKSKGRLSASLVTSGTIGVDLFMPHGRVEDMYVNKVSGGITLGFGLKVNTDAIARQDALDKANAGLEKGGKSDLERASDALDAPAPEGSGYEKKDAEGGVEATVLGGVPKPGEDGGAAYVKARASKAFGGAVNVSFNATTEYPEPGALRGKSADELSQDLLSGTTAAAKGSITIDFGPKQVVLEYKEDAKAYGSESERRELARVAVRQALREAFAGVDTKTADTFQQKKRLAGRVNTTFGRVIGASWAKVTAHLVDAEGGQNDAILSALRGLATDSRLYDISADTVTRRHRALADLHLAEVGLFEASYRLEGQSFREEEVTAATHDVTFRMDQLVWCLNGNGDIATNPTARDMATWLKRHPGAVEAAGQEKSYIPEAVEDLLRRYERRGGTYAD